MTQSFKPEDINVDELMERLREEVSKKKQHAPEVKSSPDTESISQSTSSIISSSSEINALLASAEAEIDVGGQVTSMEHFRNPLIRK